VEKDFLVLFLRNNAYTGWTMVLPSGEEIPVRALLDYYYYIGDPTGPVVAVFKNEATGEVYIQLPNGAAQLK